jgi:hypothetical protein
VHGRGDFFLAGRIVAARLTTTDGCRYVRVMAILFQCPACRQPIEIDEEWASRSVMCPFCRTTVTAPEASTFSPLAGVPVASPATGGLPASAPAPDAPPPAHRNVLAVWALVSAIAALALCFVAGAMMTGWLVDLVGPNPTQQAVREAIMDEIQAGGVPRSLVSAFLVLLLGLLLWAAGVGCAIVALRVPGRKGLAIAALVTSGVLPLMFCASMGAAPGG